MNNVDINEAYREEGVAFTILGNALCLDFARTRKWRLTQHPRELLTSYADLVLWSEAAHVITTTQGRHLLDEALRRPDDALNVVQQARVLREAIYRIFESVAEHTPLDAADMSILNDALAQVMVYARIVHTEQGFSWGWERAEHALDAMLWPVVRSAVDLLTSHELEDVRQCAASDCSGLFIDTSKNHSRRWCDMTTCGNRAKARRHYEKKRTADSVEK